MVQVHISISGEILDIEKKKQKTFHVVLSTVRGIYTRTNKKLKLAHLEYCMHPICIVFCIGMNTSKEKNSEVCDRYA